MLDALLRDVMGKLSHFWEFVGGMGLGCGWDIGRCLDRFAGSIALWVKPEQHEMLGVWEEF